MSNYPPGTWEGDPRAPWNAPDAPEDSEECPHCPGTLVARGAQCRGCDEHMPTEDEVAEAAAYDRAEQALKEEGRF